MFAASMMKLAFIPVSLVILFGLVGVISGPGCANIIPPQGGFRDSIPPILVKASPEDSSTNFKTNRITLTFDEYVSDVQGNRQSLIMSPVPKRDPEIESKLRTIIIKLKDTLEPNTTYTINFGDAIRDINEGNIAKNFTYIFSTGATFDSLTLSGKVILAESGKIDSTLSVMLHKSSDDSAVAREKPRYVTRLDSSGNFTFRNLPGGTFYIYALKTEGSGYYYTSERQLFAFADTAVTLGAVNKPITLYAYAEKTTSTPTVAPQIGIKQRGGGTEKRLRIQTNLSEGQLDLLNNFTINSELPLKDLDTSLIHLASDSSFIPIKNYQLLTDSTRKKITFQYSWKENTTYHVILDKDFAQDTLGKKLLKTDTISFKTKKLSDYGSLKLRFRNLNLSANPVLLFVQNENVVKSVPLTSAELTQSVFVPGDYQLRILSDRNKNGKWDPGEFFGKHIQPEIVTPVSSRPKITVKANWDNEFDIEAPAIPIPIGTSKG
jgi:hypothetical protein